MKVLIACEYSGIVRDAFAAKGHNAWSCDILPTESIGNHFQGDVVEHLNKGWDLMIAHPPCTYLSNAGARFLYYYHHETYINIYHWQLDSLLLGRVFYFFLLDLDKKLFVAEILPCSLLFLYTLSL